MDYRQQYAQYLQRAEDALQAAADCLGVQSRVAEAARYSLFSGGKRVRAVLCLAVCDMLGGDLPGGGSSPGPAVPKHGCRGPAGPGRGHGRYDLWPGAGLVL